MALVKTPRTSAGDAAPAQPTSGDALVAAGVDADADQGVIALDQASGVAGFVEACAQPRPWDRDVGA